MSAASIVTLALVGVLVAALAAYLIAIAYVLNKVSFMLGTILIGVRSIAHQTRPVGEIVDSIAADVAAIDQALKGLLSQPTKALGTSRRSA